MMMKTACILYLNMVLCRHAVKGAAEAEVASCEREMETIVASMNDLKTQLYAKFGNTINLEE